MTVTYLCVINKTDNPTVEYFQSLIAPYTLILFSGVYDGNGVVSAIVSKDQLDNLTAHSIVYLTLGHNSYILNDKSATPKLKVSNDYLTVYAYGVR